MAFLGNECNRDCSACQQHGWCSTDFSINTGIISEAVRSLGIVLLIVGLVLARTMKMKSQHCLFVQNTEGMELVKTCLS